MPPRPAKRSKDVVALPPHDYEKAGSANDPAFLRHRRALPAGLEIATAIAFSGPLPPPEVLTEYELTLPGLADRLVSNSERESEHRRALQRRGMRLSELGLAAAFTIAMTVVAGGIFLVHEGSSLEGMASILLAITSLVLVFLTRGRGHPADRPREPER